MSCFVVKQNNNNINSNDIKENKEENTYNKNNENNEINNNENKLQIINNDKETKLKDNILLYHNIKGHPNIRKTIKIMNLKIDNNFVLPTCEACVFAKTTRKPFPKSANLLRKAKDVGELVHSDVCGPLPPQVNININTF